MNLKDDIKNKARDLGIDLLGFSSARFLDDVRGYLERRVREGRHTTLEHSDIDERVNPGRLLPGAKTIITAGLAYFKPEPESPGGLRGIVSRSAWGKDYHQVLGNKLEQLASFISERTGAAVKVFVDTGPPVDRALAVEAGLGWSGKNCALINPEFGTWVFLGNIYTDLLLEPDRPLERNCGDCDLCLKACPTGALQEAYIINPYRCISFLTQMKGFVPREYRRLMGTKIYGCDTCQQACPFNREAKYSTEPEFVPDSEVARPELLKILAVSNRQFKESFGLSAAGWRGKTVLQRNALIALGNLRSREAVGTLIDCLRDQRDVIRGHAAWALGEIGDRSALPELAKALSLERDVQAAKELRLAIKTLQGDEGH